MLTVKQILNVLSYTAYIISSIISIGGLLGISVINVVDKYQTRFSVSNWAQIIWSVIDLSLGVLAVYSAQASQKNSFMVQECLGWNFFFVNLLSAIWMLVILSNIWLSIAIFLAIWVVTNYAYQRLSVHYGPQGIYRQVPVVAGNYSVTRPISRKEFWIFQVPFSLILGWGTILVVSNILNGVILEQLKKNENAFYSPQWDLESSLLMSVITLAACTVLYSRNDYITGFSTAFGIFGIVCRNGDSPLILSVGSFNVLLLVGASIATIRYINRKCSRLQPP